MDWNLIWKAALVVIGGTLLLRIAGRKSISQMTLAQTVIMIGIGSLLVQPIAGENIWVTLLVGLTLILTLVVMEAGQLKIDLLEKFITGQSKLLIEDGVILEKNFRRLRLTVDQLEMQLRQRNVGNLSDVQYATLEPNGQMGFILKQEKQPATKEDIHKISRDLQQLKDYIDSKLPQTKVLYKQMESQPISFQGVSNEESSKKEQSNPLFEEVRKKEHSEEPPNYLQ